MSNWDDTKRTAQSPFHDELQSGEPERLKATNAELLQENEQLKSVNAEFSFNRDNERDDIAVVVQAARAALSWIEEGKKEHPHRLQQIRDAIDALEIIIPQKSALQAENEQLKAVPQSLAEKIKELNNQRLPSSHDYVLGYRQCMSDVKEIVLQYQTEITQNPVINEPERDRDLEPDL